MSRMKSQASGQQVASPDAAVAAFVCEASAPLLAAAEQALANGVGVVFALDEKGALSGRATLDHMRALVLEGAKGWRATLADAVEPCPVVALQGAGREGLTEVATPVVDGANRVVEVILRHDAAFIPVAEPDLGPREFRNLMDAYLSTWISSTGDYIRRFEREFAASCGKKEGVATANGTVSLQLAMAALGIGPGDDVIVPDLTFAASANTVIHLGAHPVLVDVNPDTWCLDAATFEAAITPNTRAVMPVHVFGRPAQMTEICEIARRRGIYVIEDAAEAHYARYDGRPVGSFSDVASFSFFANKIMTTGEGGICVTDDPELAARMRMLRDHGMKPERRYWHEEAGYNFRMTNMQAAVGCAQLERVEDFLKMRADVHRAYIDALSDIPGVKFAADGDNRAEPVVWFSCALVPAEKRAALIEACKKANIDLRPFFNSLSVMPAYRRYARPCPVSQQLSRSGVNLPTSRKVDASVIARISDIFRTILTP
jgi:perosamine synthetase